MLLADTLAIFLVVLGFLLALPALWLCSMALLPRLVERASERAARRPILSVCLGIPITAVTIVGSASLASSTGGPGQAGAFLFASCLLAWAHLGVAGLARHIGRRLPSPVDVDQPWRSLLRGGVALELTFLIPILGWFLLLPLAHLLGVGAATLALFTRSRPETARTEKPDGEESPTLDPKAGSPRLEEARAVEFVG